MTHISARRAGRIEPVDVAVAGKQLRHAMDGVVVGADVELHVRQRGQASLDLRSVVHDPEHGGSSNEANGARIVSGAFVAGAAPFRRQFAPLLPAPHRMPTDPEDAGGLRNTLYKKETRSKRRMTPMRRFAWRIVASIGVGLIRMFWRTCRVVRVVGDEHTGAGAGQGAVADSRLLAPAPAVLREVPARAGAARTEVRLPHQSVGGRRDRRDDRVAASAATSIRGSTTHTGARALRDYYDALVKQGISPAITPDGPKGPRFVFKPGAILLSQMSQRPILPHGLCREPRDPVPMGQVRACRGRSRAS